MLTLIIGFCIGGAIGFVIGVWSCDDSIPVADDGLVNRHTVEYGRHD